MKSLIADSIRLTNGLGARRNNLYVHAKEKDYFERLRAASPLSQELWKRSGLHQRKLFANERLFEFVMPRLSEIKRPILLIKGKYDWVMPDDQVAAFRREVKRGKAIVFSNSGHYVHVEEPEHFARVVIRFVTAKL